MFLEKLFKTASAAIFAASFTLSASASDGQRLNINTATAEEIDKTLVFVSENTARKIVEYRNHNGDFDSLQEFAEVEGVSKRLARYNRSRVSFE